MRNQFQNLSYTKINSGDYLRVYYRLNFSDCLIDYNLNKTF